jgi:Ca2+-binding EF-hand superfamily protein
MIFESDISKGLPILFRLLILAGFIAVAMIFTPLSKQPGGSTRGMIFGMLFICIGIVFIFDIMAGMIEDYCDAVQKAAVAKAEKETGPEQADTPVKLVPVKSLIYLAVVLVAGTAFYANVEDWSYLQALYWCVCTCTTVGYGDLDLTQQASRGVSIVYILVSVIAFGNVIGELADNKMQARMAKQRAAIRNLHVTAEMLERMDQDEGPLEVDCGEFMAHCLAELDIMSTAESELFIEIFREIDVDGSGTLTLEDLQIAAAKGPPGGNQGEIGHNHAAVMQAEIKNAKQEVEVAMKKQMHQRESVMQQEKLQLEKQMKQMAVQMKQMQEHMEQRKPSNSSNTSNGSRPSNGTMGRCTSPMHQMTAQMQRMEQQMDQLETTKVTSSSISPMQPHRGLELNNTPYQKVVI